MPAIRLFIACAEAASDPQAYWTRMAGRLDWIESFTVAKDVSSDPKDFHIRWFADGVLNVSVNCLDRHLPHRAGDIALIWEGEKGEVRTFSYHALNREVCKFANVLRSMGVKKGDEVSIAGLGICVTKARPAREGRNPRTGESIRIAASRTPKFRPAKALKDAVK